MLRAIAVAHGGVETTGAEERQDADRHHQRGSRAHHQSAADGERADPKHLRLAAGDGIRIERFVGRFDHVHRGLRHTTVCMARFRCFSNAKIGDVSTLPTKYGAIARFEVEPASLQQQERRAGEEIEVRGERAVRQVVDVLEPGALDELEEVLAIVEHRVLRRLQPGPAIAEQTERGAVEARHFDDHVPPGFSTRCAVRRLRSGS